MCETYEIRPSELLKIDDEYTAYCFDQALAEFVLRLNNKEKPIFNNEDKRNNPGLALLL